MWYFSSCFRARGCTLWACLSRLRLCLLLGLQLEPPVATQPGQAAITPAAVLADSLGARGTFAEEEVRLMWPGSTSAGDALQPPPGPCQGCCGGSPAMLAGLLSVLGVPPLPAPTACPAAQSREGWRQRRRRRFTPLAVCPSTCSRVSTALLGHRVLAVAFTHLGQEGKMRSRGTVPGAGVPPMDFSAAWHGL